MQNVYDALCEIRESQLLCDKAILETLLNIEKEIKLLRKKVENPLVKFS